MPIHRHIKNVVHNYTDIQCKVREATSNDPWGPSSTLMAEIAMKTHNDMAFIEIMEIIWKRLNDKSKNWRHIYKSLVLLETLIKTGSEKVTIQCKENQHCIESLKNFEYYKDGKDSGQNVSQKARHLCALLKDEERLKEERARALLARDRLMQGDSSNCYGRTSVQSHCPYTSTGSNLYDKSASPLPKQCPSNNTELEAIRPQSLTEEQLQIQLALAISKEEHDKEERDRRAEEMKEEAKIRMVLEETRKDESRETYHPSTYNNNNADSPNSGLFNLVVTSSVTPTNSSDPWPEPINSNDARNAFPTVPIHDPWNENGTKQQTTNSNFTANHGLTSIWDMEDTLDPTLSKSNPSKPSHTVDLFGIDLNMTSTQNGQSFENGLASVNETKEINQQNSELTGTQLEQPMRKRTPADFLGEHQKLVDLEKLIDQNTVSTNPFTLSKPAATVPPNPFTGHQSSKPSLNELGPGVLQPMPQMNPTFYPMKPYYPVMQPTFVMPGMHTNPWPTERTNGNLIPQQTTQQTSLNPFY